MTFVTIPCKYRSRKTQEQWISFEKKAPSIREEWNCEKNTRVTWLCSLPFGFRKQNWDNTKRGWVKSLNNDYTLPASAGCLVSINLMHCKWAAVRTVITVNRIHLESSSKYEQGRKMSWKKSITLWKLWKLRMAVISTVNCIRLRGGHLNESISALKCV